MKPLIIGHRGAKSNIMENTLESILYAIDLDVDGIEFDVQKCKTGEILIFHDQCINRLAPNNKDLYDIEINDLTWTELCQIDLIEDNKVYKIPKLIDVLMHPKVINSSILINIEIKDSFAHQGTDRILEDLIDNGFYKDRLLISSFHIDGITHFRNKNYKLGYIFSKMYNTEDEVLLEVNKYKDILTHIVIDTQLANELFVKILERFGLKLFVYTVNDLDDLVYKDVDAIITDCPSVFIHH